MRIVNEISNDPNDIFVIHRNVIHFFSIKEILEKIDYRPVFVVQPVEITNEIRNNTEQYTGIIKRLKARQSIKNQQIIFINEELSLNFSFIELFFQRFNTFQTKENENDEIKLLYKDEEAEFKTFNIETKIYSVNVLNRINCSDKYGSEQKEIIEDVNSVVKQKCDSVLLNDVKDQNIIMFYLENNPNAVACF